MGGDVFARLTQPQVVDGQRVCVAGLPVFHPGVQALFQELVLISLQPAGFANKVLRPLLTQLLWAWSPAPSARVR